MRHGEPQMYSAIATTRTGEIQLRWARARVFLLTNALLLPLIVASTELVTTHAKVWVSAIGVILNSLWLSAHLRGAVWARYWEGKLAELERLDRGDEQSPRVSVFSDPAMEANAKGWTLHRQLLAVAILAIVTWVAILVITLQAALPGIVGRSGSVTVLVHWISIGAAVVAAIFWLWSARVHIPNIEETTIGGPGSITHPLRRQAQLSAYGAISAAISAFGQAVLMLWG